MNKYIVTTTIYPISTATKKFASYKNWIFIIVGDKKTPTDEYKHFESDNDNVIYLDCDYQEKHWKEFSDIIGFNTINRRNIGFLEAIKRGADIIASVDDDNIPLDNWGQDILIGKETNVYYYETDDVCFDPICVTNYENLWHRGFPIQCQNQIPFHLIPQRECVKIVGELETNML